jgi:hypothetical protein
MTLKLAYKKSSVKACFDLVLTAETFHENPSVGNLKYSKQSQKGQ